jgi:cephalosporin hydroxylase
VRPGYVEATLHPLTIARAAIHEHGGLQKDTELSGFLAVLLDFQPEVVVEIGSDAGGTLWAWRQLGSVRRVIGVDLPRAGFSTGAELQEHDAEVVHGDSHDVATLEALTKLLDGDVVDLLFIDGDHTYQGVKADWEMYHPLVRRGGIVAFHDVLHHPGHPLVEVGEAYQRILRDHGYEHEEIIDALDPGWGGIGVVHVPERVAA